VGSIEEKARKYDAWGGQDAFDAVTGRAPMAEVGRFKLAGRGGDGRMASIR
jgi:hypothetical protein